ncbi:hypothetical protein [Enterococcus durans]|nr:hypothetical protein [Enterococcus durans]
MNDEHLSILVLSLVIFSTLSLGFIGTEVIENRLKKNKKKKVK